MNAVMSAVVVGQLMTMLNWLLLLLLLLLLLWTAVAVVVPAQQRPEQNVYSVLCGCSFCTLYVQGKLKIKT